MQQPPIPILYLVFLLHPISSANNSTATGRHNVTSYEDECRRENPGALVKFEIKDAILGKNTILECDDGGRKAQLMWFRSRKDGKPPIYCSPSANNSHLFITGNDSTLLFLHIINITEEDGGCYECQIISHDGPPNIKRKFLEVKKGISTAEWSPTATMMPSVPPSLPLFTKSMPPSFSADAAHPPTNFTPNIAAPQVSLEETNFWTRVSVLFVSIVLFSLVDLFLIYMVVKKWKEGRRRAGDRDNGADSQYDAESLSTTIDGAMLPVSRDSCYKPLFQPSHSNGGRYPAYISGHSFEANRQLGLLPTREFLPST